MFFADFVSKGRPWMGAFCLKPTNGDDFAMKMDRGLDDDPLIGRPRFETGQGQSWGITIAQTVG